MSLSATSMPHQGLRVRVSHINPLWICAGLPVLTWCVAYLQMSLKYGDFWLFNNIVHENGMFTLTRTIFYFNHFLRELPIELLWSAFGLGIFILLGPVKPVGFDEKRRRTAIVTLGVLLALFVLITVAGSVAEVGLKGTIMDFLQGRNRTTETEWYNGAHWRNHFLSNIASVGWFIVLVWGYRYFWQQGRIASDKRGRALVWAAIGIFVVLTIAFGINADPFTSARYLGHQLREIPGNKMPLSSFILLGTLIFMERRGLAGSQGTESQGSTLKMRWLWGGLALFLIPSVFLGLRILSFGDIGTEIARNEFTANWSPIDVFAWHYFEHCLDFVFVILVTSLLYLAIHPESKKGLPG